MAKLLKLVILFGGLWSAYAAAGWLLTRGERGERQFGQALLLLGLILFGANIMLIAQIYHIDEHYPNGVLLWAVGGLALVYFVPGSAQPAAIAGLLLAALWSGLEVFDGTWRIHWPFLILWVLFLPPIHARGWRYGGIAAMLVLLIWAAQSGLRSVAEFPENRVYLAQVYVLGSVGLTVLGMMMGRWRTTAAFATIVQRFALLAVAFGFYLLTLRIMHGISMDDWLSDSLAPASGIWIAGTLVAVAMAGPMLAWHGARGPWRSSPALARWGYGLAAAIAALMIVNLFLPHEPADLTLVYIAFNILYFAGLAFLVYAGYEAGDAFFVNTGFVFFSIGIVTLYFDVFWTLMDRSYFFMGGGLLLFLGGYLVERQRRAVLRRMGPVLDSLAAGLPYMILHAGVTVGVLVAGVMVYIWVTPFREIELIRAGNTAAALSFMGAVLGLAIPLAFCLAGSVTALDILIWGVVVVILQLIAFRLVGLLIRDIGHRIENDEVPAAIALMTGKLAVAAII